MVHSKMSSVVRMKMVLLRGSARAALLIGCGLGVAAYGQSAPTVVNDASALQPPPGAKVAIVEFMDLECPMCAQMDPVVQAAANQHHVPWVHHDFPIPGHIWSFAAAVNARFFDSKSPALGNEYRAAVFANQTQIDNVPGLAQFTQKFANDHHVELPFLIDPGGKFDAAVKADRDLGQRTGVKHTPTIWVVAQTPTGPTYSELLDRTGLDQLIAQQQAKAGPVHAAAASTKKHSGE